MKKIILSALVAFGFGYTAQAQSVGINTDGTAANSSAILDVKATDKGILIPRVALTATNTAAPIVSPATSLMVYNTNTAGDVTPGYYFWNGSAWVRVQTGTIPIASGGTGQTTANAAINALLPTQATHNGKVLQTDGTNTSWATVAGVPTSGIIISETETNAALTSAGFTLIGSTTQSFVGLVPTPSWVATNTIGAPAGRRPNPAIWTGTEMIIWGGQAGASVYNDGGKYNPTTNSWTATTTTSAPTARAYTSIVWTGTVMIAWGGFDGATQVNTGGIYNPTTDTWTATTTTGAPAARSSHTGIWTGTEMIVWGGGPSNTGGRYNPTTDTWTATTTTGAPAARISHTGVWTGTEMIVWGGQVGVSMVNTGGRYNPATNSWVGTTTTNAPDGRNSHTAIWTGTAMIVWGGSTTVRVNTGGRYNPTTDTWTTTTTTDAPTARVAHTAVWTGTEMIVWGGSDPTLCNTGGRYNPTTDSWIATSTGTNVPAARQTHVAVWTGTEMIVWGSVSAVNTGGRLTNGGNSNKTLYYFKKN